MNAIQPTSGLQRMEPAQPGHLIRDPAGRRPALTEETCLTALFMIGGMLLLLLMVAMVRVFYLVLTMQSGMINLPVRAVF